MGLIFWLLQQNLYRPNKFVRLAILGNQERAITGINAFSHRMPEALRGFPREGRHWRLPSIADEPLGAAQVRRGLVRLPPESEEP